MLQAVFNSLDDLVPVQSAGVERAAPGLQARRIDLAAKKVLVNLRDEELVRATWIK